MRLPGQLPLAQAQAQVVAQAQVAELARLRVLVQMQAQRLGAEPGLERALELQLERKPPLVRVQGREPARQQEPAVEPEQVRELRVSRQQEPQQHRLQVVAQGLLPCRPVLPMKAPC